MRCVDLVLKMLSNVKDVKFRAPSHYIVKAGDSYYYVVCTRTVLKKPTLLGINYDGEMVGLRRNALLDCVYKLLVKLIFFVIDKGKLIEVYCVSPINFLEFSNSEGTCVKPSGTHEVVCHYPVSKLVKVKEITVSKDLTTFLK